MTVLGTKELAYVQSITSAGALHRIAEGCSKGRLPQCSCDESMRDLKPDGDFVWGGCADDVSYAYSTAKKFVDVDQAKLGRDFHVMMQLHNNEAGRLVRYLNNIQRV